MPTKIDCRICRSKQPTDGRICLGCGMAKENAINRNKKPQKRPLLCPNCHGNNYRVMEEGRFSCNGCNAVFEEDDQVFLDTRPVMNAIKKEQRESKR